MTTDRAGKSERHQRILAELRAHATVRIAELAATFSVTTETVRRDLDELSREGLINRTYGGASYSIIHEPDVAARHQQMVQERLRIAARAVELVERDDVLLIDAGSTTEHFARRLAASSLPLTVITNSVVVAATLAQTPTMRVLICPGEFNRREGGAFGAETTHFLGRFYANKAFIGAGGLTPEGVTEVDSSSSWVKRAMLARARDAVLLVDRTKFGARLFEVVCSLHQLTTLVTDTAPPDDLQAALAAAGVRVLVAR